ncbi:PrgI family mobile element protein [Dictyobacter alpinus]|uniref:PrgI family mobile element protein n=1 Tax=Dictyobacter alpinus TaxID=2014873 RepID=UPI000F83FC2C|nr:PrgI family protein [Dictyobacter alpinus]
MIQTQHKVPIHLDQPDKFILNLTGRQTIILALGLALGYMAFNAFDYSSTLILLVPALLCFALCLLLAALLAFIRVKHKDLEQWALITFMFYASPRRYLWQAEHTVIPSQGDLLPVDWPSDEEQKGQQEEW